jgi:hypothetical protein
MSGILGRTGRMESLMGGILGMMEKLYICPQINTPFIG